MTTATRSWRNTDEQEHHRHERNGVNNRLGFGPGRRSCLCGLMAGNAQMTIWLGKNVLGQSDRNEQTQLHKLDPSQMSDAMLEKLADFYLKSALGTDDPQVAAEARKQLEVGIEAGALVIEAESTAVETRST